MSTVLTVPRTSRLPEDWSLADVQKHLGDVPLERIRLFPPPGFATVEDVDYLNAKKDRLCELIDGVLLEKTMGYYESLLAMLIGIELGNFLAKNRLGLMLGEGGTLRILSEQVRAPDVCYISYSRLPDGQLPREPTPNLVPDLAIEVLSVSNSHGEMEQKRRQYFEAGVQLVWYIDPPTRSTMVYTSADDPGTRHAETEPLSGGDVLPGFSLLLSEIFARAEPPADNDNSSSKDD